MRVRTQASNRGPCSYTVQWTCTESLVLTRCANLRHRSCTKMERDTLNSAPLLPSLVCVKAAHAFDRLLRKQKACSKAGFQHFGECNDYLEEVTREWVMACTDRAIRFCTPTLRMNLATWAFTVRSSIPRAAPISLLERPATSISRTSFSRSVNVTRPAGKMRPGAELTRSMNIESTRRGAHTEP